MLSRGFAGLCGCIFATGAAMAYGQDYPSKPIRIFTAGAGGGSDFVSRFIAQGIQGPLGQQVIVENRPNGFISGEIVIKSPPDGYTLVVSGGAFWTLELIRKTSFFVLRDLAPISSVERSPLILVVHPSIPVKSVKELITFSKARPGEMNYASGGVGTAIHLAMELLKSMAAVNLVHVPYKSTGPALSDLLGGQVQVMFTSPGPATPLIKAGRLRALAVTSAEPSALAPGLPTVAAEGLPGYVSVGATGMFAPAKTPAVIINRLNQEVVRYLSRPEAKQRLLESGSEAVGNSPEQFAAEIKGEQATLGKLVRDLGLREY